MAQYAKTVAPPPSARTLLRRCGGSRRRRRRAVTLVEVLIVVAIIAMVAGGVAVFALPQFKKAKITSAKTGAQVIRAAVQQWQATTGEDTCPTVTQLVEDKHLDPGTDTRDPWGQSYQITCEDDDVVVSSRGPDKKKGTKDDITVPKGSTVSEEES